MQFNSWWARDPNESWWLEVTDREDVGSDLHIPQRRDDGTEFWGYSLIQAVQPGDVVLHYSKANAAVTHMSVATAEFWEAPTVWAAQGTAARGASIEPYERPGWWLRLEGVQDISPAVTLEELRTAEDEIRNLYLALREVHEGSLYFPFALSEKRPLRPVQGYLAKWPVGLNNLFPSLLKEAPRGVRNPPWTRDELILALDLYLRRGHLHPPSEEVKELSRLLNELPLQPNRPDASRFRNPNGVAMKLANFAALDPSYDGVGLRAGGRGDAEVWDEFATRPEQVRQLAEQIRRGHKQTAAEAIDSEEDEAAFPEGRIIYRLHRSRERNRDLVKRRKAQALKKTGTLCCEVCGFDFSKVYGELGVGFIECHHTKPLSEVGETNTTPDELALVCSNCHRMLHRRRPWLGLDELRELAAERPV